MSYSLNFLKGASGPGLRVKGKGLGCKFHEGGYMGDDIGDSCRGNEGGCRELRLCLTHSKASTKFPLCPLGIQMAQCW